MLLQLLDLGLEQFGLLLMAVCLRLVERRQVANLFDVELLKQLLQQRLDRLKRAAAAPDKREPRPQRVALVAERPVDLVRFGNRRFTK